MTPDRLAFYTHPKWMATMFETAIDLMKEGKLEIRALMKEAMKDDLVKASSKEASRYARDLVEKIGKMKPSDLVLFSHCMDEREYLEESRDFLEREFKCDVSIFAADDSGRYDPKERAKSARPWRPAIFID
ncbi:MAG: hypothetical protein ACE5IJ_06060 [Thermoplasmata archaeon]